MAVLLAPVFRRLWLAHATNVDGWTGERWLLLRVSPITILLLTGTTLTFLESLIDLPFRSPAILVTWCIALACAPAFLPSGVRSLPAAPLDPKDNAQELHARAAVSNPLVQPPADAVRAANRIEHLS